MAADHSCLWPYKTRSRSVGNWRFFLCLNLWLLYLRNTGEWPGQASTLWMSGKSRTLFFQDQSLQKAQKFGLRLSKYDFQHICLHSSQITGRFSNVTRGTDMVSWWKEFNAAFCKLQSDVGLVWGCFPCPRTCVTASECWMEKDGSWLGESDSKNVKKALLPAWLLLNIFPWISTGEGRALL